MTVPTDSTAPTTNPGSPPVEAEVDPIAMRRDPYDTYDHIRTLGPIVWVPAIKRYLATSFEACRAIEADQNVYSANVSGGAALMIRGLGAKPLLRKDDPEHAVERTPINSCMRPRNI